MNHPILPSSQLTKSLAGVLAAVLLGCTASVVYAQAGASTPAAKSADAKPPETKPADAKPADAKPEPRPTDAKPAKAKPAEVRPPETKPAEAKPAEAKPEPKPTDAKPGPKPTEAKPAEAKPAEARPPETKPAEAKPTEAKPAEGKPAVVKARPPKRGAGRLLDSRGREMSLAVLAHPSTAERAKLTPDERAKVTALVAERDDVLARTPQRERSKVTAEYERKLAALITDEQWTELAKHPPDPLLKFNYRFQRWIDVLEEVAKQAGLSLVLPEAPPPGTFNYSDAKEYTPVEAIDLLNGVLLTKGYALIRRERMLVVVDLSEEIPEGLIPRITVDELGDRGRFETVTVQFSLKGRPAATVSEEIKPLLSPHGKVKALPSTGQLLVTDAAGVMKAISAVIESMPVPPPTTAASETPSLVVYPIKKADPEAVHKALQTLLPAAKVLLDAKASQISVYGGPTYQGVAKGVIEQMEAAPADKQPRLELYPIDEASATQFMSTLQTMVPGAKLSFDPRAGKLVAFATAAEQEAIKAAVEKLAVPAKPEHALQFQVYRLSKLDPATILPLLKILFPTARIVADTPTKSLIAIASLGDQKAIKNLLDQLQPEKAGPDTPELRFYPVAHLPTTELVAALQKVAPGAQVTPDAGRKRVMVVATPAEHERIKVTLDQFEKSTPTYERNKLVIYPVTPAQRKRFESVLTKLAAEVPGIQVLPETEPGELAIWTKAEQHKVIEELLAQFKTETPNVEKSVLVAYPITAADPTSVLDLMKKLHPTVQVVQDEKTGRLLVWAHPAEQTLVKALLDQVQAPGAPSQQSRYETYAIRGADSTTLLANLGSLVPGAKLTVDAKTGRLVAWATPADHELLKGALEKLGHPGGALEGTPQVETYRLTKADPKTVVSLLESLVPEAKVSVDPQTKNLVVVAIPADQKAIKSILEQLQPEKPAAETEPQFETFPVHGLDTTALVADLQPLVPNAKLSIDAKSRKLVVLGTRAEHDAIRKALEKLRGEAGLEGTPQVETYRLTKADPKAVLTMLGELVPEAKLTVDAQSQSLIALAVPADQKTIRGVLEQLQPEKPPPDSPQLQFYSLEETPSTSAVSVLEALAPKAKITVEAGGKRLAVVATPADHQVIRAAVEQLQKSTMLEEKSRLVGYSLSPGQRKRFESVAASLAKELPGIQILPESEPGELSIWAKPSQHVVLAQIIEQLRRDSPAAEKYQLAAYPIRSADPASVMSVMKTLFPNAQFTLDAKARRLIVWTTPAEQEAIKTAMEKLDAALPAEFQEKLNVYPAPELDVTVAISALQEKLPDVKFSSDPKAGTILAWGRQSDHDLIQKMLKQMQEGAGGERKPRLVVYPVPQGDATSISLMLKSLVPKAHLAADTAASALAATATPQDHELIRSAIEQMTQKEPPETARQFVTYTYQSRGPGTRSTLISILGEHFPGARFAPGVEPDRLLVWARPTEHDAIKKAIDAITAKEPAETAHRLAIYTLEGGATAVTNAVPVLRAMYPNGYFGPGSEPGKLYAWARPAEHAQIKSTLAELDKPEPPESAPRIVVYTLHSAPRASKRSSGAAGAGGVISVLKTMFPDVQISVGTEPNKLVVLARPAEHQKIQAAIDVLDKEEPPETAPRVVVYSVEAPGPKGIAGITPILEAMFPGVQFTLGTEPGKLVVLARPAEHEKIKSAIDEICVKEPPETARRFVTYTVDAGRRGAISTLISILSEQYPGARISAGLERGHILVWARPDEHKKIQATIDELTKNAPPPELGYKLSIYSVESGGSTAVSNAIGILKSMFPDAYFSSGSEPGKLVVWARPQDHPRIEGIIKEVGKPEPPETAPRIVVYTLHAAPATRGTPAAAGIAGVLSVMRTMFPSAEFSPGTEPNKLVVLARPAEHAKIKAAIDELDKPEPPETAHRVAVYTVRSSTPTGSSGAGGPIAILSAMFPDAKFSAATEPDKVIAWARPDDQKAIAQAVAAMSEKDPPGKAPIMVAYTLETVGRYGDSSSRFGLIGNLRQAFPEAIFFPGAGRNRLVAWARPEDHDAIKKAIEEMSKREPAETAPKVEVYEVESLGATAAVSFLSTAFPDAQFSPGTDPNKLVVRARPGDHELIKATIEQMEAAWTPASDRVLTVHPFRSGDLTSFNELLDPALRRNVQLVVDPARNRLLVWAGAKHQEAIGKAIDQFTKEMAKAGEPKSEVYRFDWADPKAAYTVLSTLVPNANIALDVGSRSLVVSAMPEDHAKIKATIGAMDRRDGEGQGPRLELHRMQAGDPAELLPILQGLFKLRPEVQLTLDAKNDAIVAFCTSGQHEMIRSLIAQVEKAISADSAARLQIYPMEDREASAILRTLNTVLEKQGVKADISIDPRSRNLVAIARPEAHKRIEEVLSQLPAEKRTLEIIQLEVLDPSTAELAIERLFGDGLGFASGHAPVVDVDSATQQLFIRATAPQHAKVRELLVKMGETGVVDLLSGEARRSRVIPFEGDLSAAVEEIRKVWPQLRSNPIHVVSPPPKISIQGRSPKKDGPSGDGGGKSPKPRVRPAAGPTNVPPATLPKNEAVPGGGRWRPGAPAPDDRAGRPDRPKGPTPQPGPPPAATDGWRASAAKPTTPAADKPVVIIPGDGNITIASDDPEALAQIEELLRAFSRQRGTIGRNYSIFMLENAKASQVAAVLQNLFRRMPGAYASGAGAVTVVPDDRLNALVVYAGRTDRTTIENLLKSLDSSEMPEPLAFDRLQMIPVKNTSATVMERMLHDLYGNQIDSVSIEERTNSIVVMTSPAMFEQIKRVVDLLDERAGGESARTVQIIRLQNATAERVGDALSVILPKAAPGAGRAVRRSSAPSPRLHVPESPRRTPRRSSSSSSSQAPPGRPQVAPPAAPRAH